MINEKIIELFSESVKNYLENKKWHENSLESLNGIHPTANSGAIYEEIDRATIARAKSFQFVSGVICGFASTIGLSNKEAAKRLFFEAGLTEVENIIQNF